MDRSTKAYTLTRAIGLLVVGALLGALANMTAPPLVAHATSISVDTADDELNGDGDCSLREAIMAANTNAGVDNCAAGHAAPNLDTITFDPTVDGAPIVLLGAAGEDGNAGGDLDIWDGGGNDLDPAPEGGGAGRLPDGQGAVCQPGDRALAGTPRL
jgi:CSLREA domain-containing protein